MTSHLHRVAGVRVGTVVIVNKLKYFFQRKSITSVPLPVNYNPAMQISSAPVGQL